MTAATGALHITPSEEAEKKENLELTPQQAVYAGSESEVEQLKQEIRKKELEWKEQEEEFEREKKRLRQEIKTLSEENDALKTTMKRKKTLIEEQDDEKNHMDTLVRRKTREIETLKEDFESKEKEILNQEEYIEEKRGQIEMLPFQLSVSKEKWDKDGKELLIQTKNELKEILSENYTKEKNEEFQFILNQISRNKSEISDQMAGTKSVILKKLYDLQTSRNYDSQDTNNPTIVNIHGNVESLGSIGGQNNRNKNESIKDQTKAKLEDSSTKGSVREDGKTSNSKRDIQAGRDVYSNLRLNSLLISSSVIVIAVLLYINRK